MKKTIPELRVRLLERMKDGQNATEDKHKSMLNVFFLKFHIIPCKEIKQEIILGPLKQ